MLKLSRGLRYTNPPFSSLNTPAAKTSCPIHRLHCVAIFLHLRTVTRSVFAVPGSAIQYPHFVIEFYQPVDVQLALRVDVKRLVAGDRFQQVKGKALQCDEYCSCTFQSVYFSLYIMARHWQKLLDAYRLWLREINIALQVPQ